MWLNLPVLLHYQTLNDIILDQAEQSALKHVLAITMDTMSVVIAIIITLFTPYALTMDISTSRGHLF